MVLKMKGNRTGVIKVHYFWRQSPRGHLNKYMTVLLRSPVDGGVLLQMIKLFLKKHTLHKQATLMMAYEGFDSA